MVVHFVGYFAKKTVVYWTGDNIVECICGYSLLICTLTLYASRGYGTIFRTNISQNSIVKCSYYMTK